MADVPDGAELIVDARLGFPTIKCENVYILPGIPEILEQKFQSMPTASRPRRTTCGGVHARRRGLDRGAS
jgi:molybdopterin-biosynthesis enzyme MoeA-like protein